MKTILFGKTMPFVRKAESCGGGADNTVNTRIGRPKSQMVGRLNLPLKSIEFEGEICRWSTSSIPDDIQELSPHINEVKTSKHRDGEANPTVTTVHTTSVPSVAKSRTRTAKIASPSITSFSMDKKEMTKTVPARLCVPPKKLELQVSHSFQNATYQVVEPDNPLSEHQEVRNRPQSKHIGVWGYRARYVQSLYLSSTQETSFSNENWRNRIRNSVLCLQCSFRMHMARKNFIYIKKHFCPKTREKSRGALQLQLRTALLKRRFPHQVQKALSTSGPDPQWEIDFVTSMLSRCNLR